MTDEHKIWDWVMWNRTEFDKQQSRAIHGESFLKYLSRRLSLAGFVPPIEAPKEGTLIAVRDDKSQGWAYRISNGWAYDKHDRVRANSVPWKYWRHLTAEEKGEG